MAIETQNSSTLTKSLNFDISFHQLAFLFSFSVGKSWSKSNSFSVLKSSVNYIKLSITKWVVKKKNVTRIARI